MLKLVNFSFGSLASASADSNPISDIKPTEDKTNILTPFFSGSIKKVLSFGSLAASASPKISGGGIGK